VLVLCVAHADDSKELARVGPGQCFGEMALLSGDTRAANVMALDNSEVRRSCGGLVIGEVSMCVFLYVCLSLQADSASLRSSACGLCVWTSEVLHVDVGLDRVRTRLLCTVLCCVQALLLDRSAFHSLLGKLDSLRSMWRFEVRE
jgi:hypothetical protein